MSLFSFPRDQVLTPFTVIPPELASEPLRGGERGARELLQAPGRTAFAGEDGASVAVDDLKDQFVLFHLSNRLDAPTILESSQAEPTLEGSEDKEPDALVNLSMLSFHVSGGDQIDRDTRATMRINFGKDENSTDTKFDTAFWSIAAGLKLYDQYKNNRVDDKDLRTDFRKAFGNRPIEVPGGLGRLSFEVIKHREPQWWQRIFQFLESGTGTTLISVLGFPGIARPVIEVVDELLNRLTEAEPEVLFKSIPMRLALSKWARDEFTAGNPRIRVGCLNPGFCVLARGRDFATIAGANAFYHAAYGKLVPADVDDAALLSGRYRDPFEDATYAVFRVGMKLTKLDPTFSYGT